MRQLVAAAGEEVVAAAAVKEGLPRRRRGGDVDVLVEAAGVAEAQVDLAAGADADLVIALRDRVAEVGAWMAGGIAMPGVLIATSISDTPSCSGVAPGPRNPWRMSIV